MSVKTIVLTISLLLLSGLACSTLSSSDALPAGTATPLATPTLAPTVALDAGSLTSNGSAPTPIGGDLGTPGPEQQAGDQTTPETQAVGEATTDSGGSNGGGGEETNGNGDPGQSQDPPATTSCPAGGTNLLTNPSFEGQYKPFGAFKELNHAPQWFPWWKDGENNLRPEFKPAEAATAPNRVHSGSTAQQYFKSFGMFKSGVYQSVLNVTPGSRLQFSAYGQAWSCEEFSMCPDGRSVNPADMFMRVGIEPHGDTNWESGSIVWSDYFNPLDQWQIACVEAVAESDVVTVFLWASPNGPRQNQDVYWDDASLVVLP